MVIRDGFSTGPSRLALGVSVRPGGANRMSQVSRLSRPWVPTNGGQIPFFPSFDEL